MLDTRVCRYVYTKSLNARTCYLFGVNVIINPEAIIDPSVTLPVISIAATVENSPYSSGVPYPLLHALLFYFRHQGINLGYHFNWHFCLKEEIELHEKEEVKTPSSKETVWYPHSLELAEDIFNLNAGGILKVERGSGMLVAPGPLITENPERFISRFEQKASIPYERLSDSIIGVLVNPRKLLDDCYKLYVTEL